MARDSKVGAAWWRHTLRKTKREEAICMKIFSAALLLAIALIPGSSLAENKTSRILTTGSWCSRTDVPAFFQEIEFDSSEGKNEFHSWLHARPDEEGTWRLEGKTLALEGIGARWNYRIIRLSAERLVLENQNGGGNSIEHYFRTECDLEHDPFRP